MLTLHYNGSAIPTGKDFSLRLSWVNPCCYFDQVPGNAGLGIDIPVNEYSRAIFGNPERFEKYTTSVSRKFPGFQVRYSGVLLIDGTLIITNANAGIYSGWLQSNVGIIGEEQRDRFIPGMVCKEDPDIKWKEAVTFANKPAYGEGVDEYNAYPVFNGAFWNGKGREIPLDIEYTDEDGEAHKYQDKISYLTAKFRQLPLNRTINQPGGPGVIAEGEACVVSPYLYLRYVIKQLLKINRLFIGRNDMVPQGIDLALSKYLLLYNNFNIMEQVLTYEEINYPSWDREMVQFDYTPENKITGVTWLLGSFNYSDLLPYVSLKDFILGLQNYLNFVFYFRPLSKVDIIDRNEVLSGDAFDLEAYFTGEWILGEQKNVSLKFVSEFDKEDRMFGQQYHDLTGRLADFGEPVGTFSDLGSIADPVIGELRLVKDTNKVYEYKWKVLTYEDVMYLENQADALGWEFVSSGPQPYVYGSADEIEEIKTVFSTPQVTNVGPVPLPVVLQQGNIAKMRQLWLEFSPRLINSNEILYPAALNWEGENGLFEKRWKKWAGLWVTRLPVEGLFNLPLNMVCYVAGNIHSKFRTRNGEFVIETMETEFSSNMVGLTRIKGYKI